MFEIKIKCHKCKDRKLKFYHKRPLGGFDDLKFPKDNFEKEVCPDCNGKGCRRIPWYDWLLWQIGKLLNPYVKEYGE
jgi:hypothetical protein